MEWKIIAFAIAIIIMIIIISSSTFIIIMIDAKMNEVPLTMCDLVWGGRDGEEYFPRVRVICPPATKGWALLCNSQITKF